MANAAVVGILRALLTASSAEFETAMKRSADSAKVFSRDMQTVGRQASAVGASLTKVLTLPIVGLGGSVAKLAIDFESSFAGVRKTVDATDQEFAQMAEGFRELSRTIPVNVNELNRLGEAAGALGIPKERVVDFARVMAMLGVTTNLTADQAATAIARIQNIFGAAGQDTERLASTIVALGNAGASTEAEIVEMAQRIAGAGHTVGLTQAQVVSFASALASVGINAEAGGSSISRVFLKMNDAVMDGGKALEAWAQVAGMSTEQFRQAFQEDAASAMVAFIDGLGRLRGEGENINQTIQGLVGKNIILKDTLLRLSGAGAELSRQIGIGNRAWEENSALTEEARKRFETTAAQLTQLWIRIKDVGITIGNALLPGIKSLVQLLTSALPGLDQVGKAIGSLPGPVQAVGIGLLAVTAAAGPAIFVFGQLALAASAVTAAFTAKGIATRGLAASLVGLRTAVPTLAAGLSALGATFALSATQATALGLTVSGLGAAAGVAAAGFVGWQLGKWIGDVTGLTNAVEYLAGKMMGLSDAHIKAAREARLQGEAVQDLSKSLQALAARDIAGFANSTDAARQKARDLAQDLPAAERQVTLLALAVRNLAREGQLTPSVMQELARQARSLSAQGAKLPPELENIVIALDRMQPAATTAAQGLAAVEVESAETTAAAAKLKDALKDAYEADLAMGRQALMTSESMRELGLSAMQSGGIIADSFQLAQQQMAAFVTEVKDAPKFDLSAFFTMGTITPPSMDDFKRTLGTTFIGAFQQLPSLLTKAFTGGGGVSGALNALGAQISEGLFGVKGAFAGAVGKATGGLTNLFGRVLGGALGAAIPGIGALIGPALQALWGGIKKLFGGPSEEELAGREVKRAFQESFGGFEQMLTAVADAYVATGRSADQARQDVERLMAAERQGADAVKAVVEEINAVFAEQQAQFAKQEAQWDGVQRSVGNLNAFVAEGIDSVGKYNIAVGSAVAIFDAWVKKTGDVAGAIQQIGPALDQISLAQTDLGFAGNSAIDQLLRIREVAEAQQPLMANIGQSTMLLTSLGQAGLLTNELVTAFGQNAVNQFTLLKAATGDGTTALALMQPELQQLWEHQQKFGEFADEATQDLINQAAEQGLVGPEMKDINEQIRDVMIEIRDAIVDATGKTGLFGKAISELPTDHTLNVDVAYHDPGYEPSVDGAARGGRVTPHGVQHFSRGGFAWPRMGTDTIPAMLTPGELILTAPQQEGITDTLSALHARAASGPGGDLVIRSSVVLNDREIGYAVERIQSRDLLDRYRVRAN